MYVTVFKESPGTLCVPAVDIFDVFFRNMQPVPEIAAVQTAQQFRRTFTKEYPGYGGFNARDLRISNAPNNLIGMQQGLDMSYREFRIPKASGGYRTIHAPNESLKLYQHAVTNFLRHTCKLLWHDCAYAYIEGRSTKHALQQHQQNESNWFLKLDLKNFFPSCNREFVLTQLHKLYPLVRLSHDELNQILNGCFLENALPQGSPASPMLSNLLMIPIDYAISRELYNYEEHRFIYTRYADDILISCKEHFNPTAVTNVIKEILPDNLRINDEKTRYGSKAGRNWNLGLMLNGNNDITIGYKEKQRLRAAIHAYCLDHTLGTDWSAEDKAHLKGQLSYLKYIEPEYHDALIKKYSDQFNRFDIIASLK